MSKKTRKKSSKSAPGRSAGKSVSKKAKSASNGTSKTAKGAKGAKAKRTGKTGRPAKSAASGKAAAKPPKTARRKGASKNTAAAGKTPPKSSPKKSVATPVRKIATLNEGDTAPAFSLPRDGGELVSLASYTGRKLVIFFYPRADTPGCTLEAVAFSRLSDAFAAAQTAVLGVSADAVKAQESFRDKHDLTVPLVSDETLGMLKAYGVWGEKSMYGKTFMGITRTTVLVDGDGKIARIWRNVKVEGHADEVLAAARVA